MAAVGSLLAVFGFLPGRTTAMGASNVLLLLGLGLHLALVGVAALATTAKGDAVLQNLLKIRAP